MSSTGGFRPDVIALAVVLAACGARAPDADSPTGAPDDPLRGAWRGPSTHAGREMPCPFEIEFFADGTVETNYLNDDSDEAGCSFARLPFRTDLAARPARVTMGGQLMSCIFAREGDFLRLSCEDHPRPPPDFDDAFVLQRVRVHERHGLAALVGSWRGSAHWGPAAALEIAQDGRVRLEDRPCRIDVHGRDRLSFACDGGLDDRCLYRVTDRRLTLHCQPAARGYPASMVSAERFGETVVLVRGGRRR